MSKAPIRPARLARGIAIALALGLSLRPVSAAPPATEITQIANNVQLGEIAQRHSRILAEKIGILGKTVQEVATRASILTNTVQQWTAVTQLLATFPHQLANLIANSLGISSFTQLRAMVRDFDEFVRYGNLLQSDFIVIVNEYHIAEGTIQRMRELGYESFDGDDYIDMVNELARRKDENLARRAEMFQRAVKSAEQNLAQIRRLTEQSPAIRGQIEGIQVLNATLTEALTAVREIEAILAARAISAIDLAHESTESMRDQIVVDGHNAYLYRTAHLNAPLGGEGEAEEEAALNDLAGGP